LNHKIFAFGTFLDIEGAFDNVSFTSPFTFYGNEVLKNRTERAEIRGVSSMMKVRRGCPQGWATGLTSTSPHYDIKRSFVRTTQITRLPLAGELFGNPVWF
jgi:hypothetical protein